MCILDHVWGESAGADRVWSQFAGMRPSLLAGRHIMVLQAYIDDSVDDDSGVFVLAGYVSTAEKWAQFSAEWEAMLPRAIRNKTGKFRFKMSEMAERGRWDDIKAFHNIICRYAQLSVSTVINKYDVENVFRRLRCHAIVDGWQKVPVDIKSFKIGWGNPYYVSLRLLIDSFHISILNNPQNLGIKEPVDFYFDDMFEKS